MDSRQISFPVGNDWKKIENLLDFMAKNVGKLPKRMLPKEIQEIYDQAPELLNNMLKQIKK